MLHLSGVAVVVGSTIFGAGVGLVIAAALRGGG